MVGNAEKQLFQLLLVQNHLAFQLLLGLCGFISGLHRQHHVRNLLMERRFVQTAEIILLVKLYTMFLAVVGGDGLYHGIVAYLGFVQPSTVDHGFLMLIQEYFHRVEGAIGELVGVKNDVGNRGSQIFGANPSEITLYVVCSCFVLRERIGLVINQHCLGSSLRNQLCQFLIRGRGVDQEVGIPQKFSVRDVHGHLGIAGVGAAHCFQLALHKEHFKAFDLVNIDFIVRHLIVGPEHGFQFHHPSFTLAFSAGPPSLTRTHSL